MRTIGDVMKEIRERVGLSPLELADKCGWTEAFVENLECGKVRLSDWDNERFYQATGMSPYIYAIVKHVKLNVPEAIRMPTAALVAGWDQDVSEWEANLK